MYNKFQIGFKAKQRTSDHILVLKTLIDSYIKQGKKLYTCFIDFAQCFDTVWRDGLFYKLLKYNIGGSFYGILRSMYQNNVCSVKVSGGRTEPFYCNNGVKQGCTLSPSLFNLYVNDLPEIFDTQCDPVTLNTTSLNCLMYADDLILLSGTENGLQKCLDRLELYCSQWHLSLNLSKTKTVIFRRNGHKLKAPCFRYGNQNVESADSYCYLGLTLKSNGDFKEAVQLLCDKATKASFCLTKSLGNHNQNIQICLRLYDSMIKPILLYGSEVWGAFVLDFEKLFTESEEKTKLYDTVKIEQNHMKFCKYLLGVHRFSTNNGVRGELGRFPLILVVICSLVSFWHRLTNLDPNDMLVAECLPALLEQNSSKNWIVAVKCILEKLDLQHVWESPSTLSAKQLKKCLNAKMKNMYCNQWYKDIWNDNRGNTQHANKLRCYRGFKQGFAPEPEPYLMHIKDKHMRSNLTKLRISAHKLQIEKGRHYPQYRPAKERICRACNIGLVESEVHFVLYCDLYNDERRIMMDGINNIYPVFSTLSDVDKFNYLMSVAEADTCNTVATYIRDSFTKRSQLIT